MDIPRGTHVAITYHGRNGKIRSVGTLSGIRTTRKYGEVIRLKFDDGSSVLLPKDCSTMVSIGRTKE